MCNNDEIKYMTCEDMIKLQLELDGDTIYENGKQIFVICETYKDNIESLYKPLQQAVTNNIILDDNIIEGCIISESFKYKLEKIKDNNILIGDIIEDNINKICILKILPDKELLDFYGRDIDIVLPSCNYQDRIINTNLNFHPVMHIPKKLMLGDE